MSHEPAHFDCVQPTTLEDRLVAYLDGELGGEEARNIEQLLAADSKVRELLAGLDHAWALLDKLSPSPVDDIFTQSTIEMVAVTAAKELAGRQAEIPRRRRRRWWIGASCLAAAAAAGFLAVALCWPNPNRELLQDLPVLEDLDELQRVFNKDEDVRFLRLLREHKLFVKDAADDS